MSAINNVEAKLLALIDFLQIEAEMNYWKGLVTGFALAIAAVGLFIGIGGLLVWW